MPSVLGSFHVNKNLFTLPAVYGVDSSPGPKYHIDAKISRFGKDGTPAYSMLGRMKAESKFSSVSLSTLMFHRINML